MKKRLLSLLVTVLMLCCLAPAAALAATSTVTDPPTIWSWQDLIKDTYGQDSTANVGRIWTDKTVSDGELANAGITVEKKGDNATFLTALSALSSTSNLASTATTPLDIVLVLDTSSSMNSNYVTTSAGNQVTRLRALKDAAKNFVATIAEQNNSISDADKQHRVAVVTFNSSAATPQAMTVCAGESATTISTTIENLGYSQGTRSNLGLQYANDVLTTSKRDGAKQVVVFFTDGTPTTTGNFTPSIASPAVTAAKTMKDAGATVYAIGILSDTDTDPVTGTADSASNENKFMHAVSSNYPSATYDASTWTFGNCAASKYYKNATTAEELKQIFSDISDEIVNAAKYPTSTTEGAENESGYITFYDQLGAYMRVTDLSTLVYDRVVYTSTGKTSEGLVDTYHFAGEVNSGIVKGDLSDIVVTVTRSNNLATGDLVEVKIPATLIPLRHFNVDLTNNTMDVTENRPIAVLYSSGLKDGVTDLLANPDVDMAAYIEANTDATTGQVVFYANKWSGGELGDTTSQFNPASTNSFYYFTEDTPIYIYDDADCDERATGIIADGEHAYCYRHYYYALENGKPVQKFEIRSIPADTASSFDGAIIKKEDGYLYMKAGTARLVHINSLHKDKDPNNTGTASDVLNPKWNSETSVAAATTVTPHLGNNGKLMVDKPATLEVKKTVEVDDGYDLSKCADKSFEFTIGVPAAAGKSLQAEVLADDGTRAGDAFTLAFDAQGNATHSIKHDETLKVYGLEAGWTYTVSEDASKLPAGFTQKSATGATGTFAAGQTATASFTNKYSATGTLEGKTNLAGEKILTGRNWLDSDLFTFKIEGTGDTPNAPLPKGADGTVADTVSVNKPAGTPAGDDNPVAFSFGDITYDTTGTYYYKVYESGDDSIIINPRVTASQAVYQVVVTVTDNGNGTLTVTAVKTQTSDDAGAAPTGDKASVSSMAFTNTYEAGYDYGARGGLQVSKAMTGRDLGEGEFAFTITGADNASAALLTDADRRFVNDSARKEGEPNVMTKLAGVKFTQADAGKTFTFEVAEVIPADADKLPGVTYDAKKHAVQIAVADNGDGTLTVVTAVDGVMGNVVEFTNKYTTTNATFDTAEFGLTKRLTGREWKDGETFQFWLDALTEGAPMPGTNPATATQNGGFSFGEIIYAAPGTYEYQVREFAGRAPGMTYDTHTAKFKVTVTDLDEQGNHTGKLAATAELVEGSATFVNTYTKPTVNYDTAEFGLTKQLTGREWKDGESFEFKLEAETEGAPMPEKTTATATQNGSFDFGKITYDAVGTYEYKVSEVVPQTEAGGMAYDTNVAKFKVTVTENFEGQLVATAELVSGSKTFTNKYTTTNGSYDTATAGFEKVISGRDWVDGDSFTFNLTAVTAGAPMPQKTTATVTKADVVNGRAPFSFGTMTYATAGTYEYQVTEAVGRLAGITYDTHTATVKVTVTDDGEGHLVAAPVVTGPIFTNTYGTSMSYTAAGSLSVAKTLTGRDMANGQFTITVTPDNPVSADALGIALTGAQVSVPAAADGAQATVDVLAGHDVTFSQENTGHSYTYKVTESYTAASGYTYDTDLRTVSIAVTDDPATATLTATTTVTGGPEGAQVFTYTKEGAANGKKAVVPFYNSYFATTDIEGGTAAQVRATKSLTGRDMAVGEFTFGVHLVGSDRDVLTATNAADGSVTLGSLHYDTKSLAQLVAQGHATRNGDDWTVCYVAYEKTDGLADKGITAMTQPIAFTVTVHDNGDGTLTATANVPDDGLAFANAYATGDPAQVNVTGVKVLTHDEGLTPNDITGKFTFTIASDDPAAPLPTSVTATNDANGNIDFGAISFTLDDLNRALGLTEDKKDAEVDEKDAEVDEPAVDAVALDETKPVSQVNEPRVSEPATDEPATDEPAVEAPVANEQQVEEPVVAETVAEPVVDPEPMVLLSTPVVSDVPVASSDVEAETANDAEVKPVTEGALEAQPAAFFRALSFFKPATFSAAKRASETVPAADASTPATRSYTFVYTVTETGSVAGVTNDTQVKTVSIKVTDDGLGHLTAELVGEDGEPAFTFTNSYDVVPVTSSVTDQIDVTKHMIGRDLTGGDFTFELVEGNEVVARGSNSLDGTVSMAPVTYTEPGTHHYTLREVGGGLTEGGVTYDGTTFQVDTVVTDNGDGTLAVTHKVADAQDVVFTNSYVAKPTSVVIGAAKVLKGSELKDGQFTFKLVGEGIELTAKNAADGTVTFDALDFGAPGTYEYDVYEVNDGQANVTYDEAKHHVIVTVTDDGEGHLVAEVAGDEDRALTFTNTYAEPVVPTPEPDPTPTVVEKQTVVTKTVRTNASTPYTGDQVTWTVAALLGACALILAGVALALRRARK